MLGAVIAQLFRLENASPPPTGISLYNVGVPLGCVCQGTALVTVLAGCHRFLHHQSAMASGEANGAGWEIWMMFVVVGLVSYSDICLSLLK